MTPDEAKAVEPSAESRTKSNQKANGQVSTAVDQSTALIHSTVDGTRLQKPDANISTKAFANGTPERGAVGSDTQYPDETRRSRRQSPH
jgi:hypothetical protein